MLTGDLGGKGTACTRFQCHKAGRFDCTGAGAGVGVGVGLQRLEEGEWGEWGTRVDSAVVQRRPEGSEDPAGVELRRLEGREDHDSKNFRLPESGGED